MTPTQFRTALDRMDLSDARFACLVGAHERTPHSWAAGRRSVPESVAILVRLLLSGRITTDDVEKARR